MILLAFLLIPAALAVKQEREINNYVVEIDEGILTSVKPTSIESLELNLSGLGLRIIEANVFDNLVTLKNLDLSNNLLSSIPDQLFSNLENLQYLSLANNNLDNFEKTFEGLDNLRTLNISNNPLVNLKATALYGLPKTSLIFTKGLSFESINAFVFENEPGIWSIDQETIDNYEYSRRESQEETESAGMNDGRRRVVNENQNIMVCMENDLLIAVKHWKSNELLPSHCRQGELSEDLHMMDLENFGIAQFKENWYQLNTSVDVKHVLFGGNNIVHVTPELLNDLPSTVFYVDLGSNKIERLEKDVMENTHILLVNLSSNVIREIEDNAFMNVSGLLGLYLNDNLLTSTTFMTTLPPKFRLLFASRNRITEIAPHSLTTSSPLLSLFLDGNQIEELRSDSFNGIPDLLSLNVSDNRISKIESGSFQQIKRVFTIDLRNNSILGFEDGTFNNLYGLRRLDVSDNKLTDIKQSFPNGIPSNLTRLKLSFNAIEKLESDVFQNVPLKKLVLDGNKISKIEHGALNLPTLKELKLNQNELTQLDTESFRGLINVREITLSHNHITSIPKGFTKNMDSLNVLDLSHNPIQRLQDGALHGFKERASNKVLLKKAPIEIIERGVFDDV